MKATHTDQFSNISLSDMKGKRRFFTLALGLGLTVFLGVAGAMFASNQHSGNSIDAVSMQQLDAEGRSTASTNNCVSGQVERIKVDTGRRGTRVYARSGRTQKVCS